MVLRHEERELPMATHDYLKPDQLSELINVAKSTLARWRVEGNGPPFMKAGRAVLYAANDVHEWLAKSARQSTSEATH